MTATEEVLRAVATLSPHGEWVTATEVARALSAPRAEVIVAIGDAVQRRMLDQARDESGILWTRARIRRTSRDASDRGVRRATTTAPQPGRRCSRALDRTLLLVERESALLRQMHARVHDVGVVAGAAPGLDLGERGVETTR